MSELKSKLFAKLGKDIKNFFKGIRDEGKEAIKNWSIRCKILYFIRLVRMLASLAVSISDYLIYGSWNVVADTWLKFMSILPTSIHDGTLFIGLNGRSLQSASEFADKKGTITIIQAWDLVVSLISKIYSVLHVDARGVELEYRVKVAMRLGELPVTEWHFFLAELINALQGCHTKLLKVVSVSTTSVLFNYFYEHCRFEALPL